MANNNRIRQYWIRGARLDILDWPSIENGIRAFAALTTERRRQCEFPIVDTYTAAVLASGYLLVRNKDGQHLIACADLLPPGNPEAESRTRTEQTPVDFAGRCGSVPAEAFRKKYYEGWKLLDLGTLHLDTTEYMCRNDAGKGIARLWLVSLRAKTLVQLLYFVPLLGYEQEARSLYRFLKNGAGLSPASANRHPFHAALGLRLFTKSDHAVDLDKATTAILGTRLRFYARSAFLQIDGILRDVDPECLHQFRVELRKMRSLIVLFKSFLTSYHAELKLVLDELMTRTNRLRDLDVLLISCHDCVRSIGNKKAYHALMERLSNERNNEQALVASWLHSDSCKRDIHRAIQLLKKRSPVWRRSGRDVAMATALAERIARAYANVQTTTLAMNPEATSAEIHRLRIIHKRLRYLLDFSQDLKPCQATMALLNTMKTSQKHLGNFNDTVIQLDWLKSWEEEHADTLTAPEKEALVTIVQLMETRAHEQRSSAIGHAGESVGSGAEELVQAIVQQRGSP